SIVCNSIVRNRILLERIRPRLIVSADPVFHAGCSSYAGAFRSSLGEALDATGAYLAIQERDAHIYRAYLPPRLSSRIIPIPIAYGSGVNFDFQRRFALYATKNVLTMFMLPIAFALADRIAVLGCDGRPVSDNRYFWRHDSASQFDSHMESVKRTHPGFFTLSYNAYYALHCETVRRWIVAAERAGKTVENLTPSYIPALADRSASGVGRLEGESAGPARFLLHSRVADAQRAVPARYGALLGALSRQPRLQRAIRMPLLWGRALAAKLDNGRASRDRLA